MHNKIISHYFSKDYRYWQFVYQKENETDSLLSDEMRLRKDLVYKIIDESTFEGNLKVLDCGAGSGIFTKKSLQLGHQVVSLDISSVMMNLTKQNISEKLKIKWNGTVADIENMPFLNSLFDIIICVGTIQYVKNENAAIKEFYRILKKNGKLIFTIPNVHPLKNIFDPYYYFYRCPSIFINKFKNKLKKEKDNLYTSTYLSNNIDLRNKRYFYCSLLKMLKENNFEMKKYYAIGWGPFTFLKKELFNNTRSKKICKKLTLYANSSSGSFLKIFANRWVIYAEKR